MNKNNLNPVLEAFYKRDLKLLSQELARGAPVDSIDRDGWTALFYAARDGEDVFAQELLRHAANVNAKDNSGRTPLHIAAQNYQLEIGNLLLANGAEVDTRDIHGNTPLSDAVFESRGRSAFIKLLLSAGADKMMKNNYGISPEELASSIANYDIRQFL